MACPGLTTDEKDSPVPQGRHRLLPAEPVSTRTGLSRTQRRALVGLAPLATLAVVGAGVVLAEPGASDTTSAATSSAPPSSTSPSTSSGGRADLSDRDGGTTSRSMDRVQVARQLAQVRRQTAYKPPPRLAAPSDDPTATGARWATDRVDLKRMPERGALRLGTVAPDQEVAVTGNRVGAFSQVVSGGDSRWVRTDRLTADEPQPDPADMPLVDRSCPGTSGVEGGLTDSAVRVYRAVCNNFPQIRTYGGYDAHGEHSTGKAIDVMTSDPDTGYAIADFLKAHASDLDLYDVIYRQRIWTPERASEGWRSMPDRGSDTANHYDHVHVSVN